jgi:predicted RNA-binding Zn-ribbon protein involved in translation (DUF1610 family)
MSKRNQLQKIILIPNGAGSLIDETCNSNIQTDKIIVSFYCSQSCGSSVSIGIRLRAGRSEFDSRQG